MDTRKASNDALKGLQWGMHDAVINGQVVQDIPSKMVYVKDEDELDRFTDISPVGTIAAMYGLSALWQLDSDRTWVQI